MLKRRENSGRVLRLGVALLAVGGICLACGLLIASTKVKEDLDDFSRSKQAETIALARRFLVPGSIGLILIGGVLTILASL